jgi:hypothetical protein
MKREWVARLVLAWWAVWPAHAQASSVTLKLVDMGNDDAVVAAAQVRVLDTAGKTLKTGITNENGEFAADNLPAGTPIVVEYGRLGWVPRPDRYPDTGALVLADGENRQVQRQLIRAVEGGALSAADRDYYVRVGVAIGDQSRRAPPAQQQKLLLDHWMRTLELPATAQEAVARELLRSRPPGLVAIEDRLKLYQFEERPPIG